MATTSTFTYSLVLLSLSLLVLTATARPCKTLFFYSTTTYFPQNPNPNFEILPNFPKFRSYSPKFSTFFITSVNAREENDPYISYFSLRRTRARTHFPIYLEKVVPADKERQQQQRSSVIPLGIYSSMTTSSIRDRTKDIMSVVGGLLFGVGCGALTAATMYLVWSLFSPHRFDFDDSDDDDDDVSPKKVGYVAIPDDVDLVKKQGFDFAPKKEVA